ncbi:hypothetical protein [Streptomyces exfoliatus]|uniref:hypothetical protein n=1 Tax=Streptomyces exfoliatus TaxID=1905 RepID=UPI003C30E711
MSAPTQPPAQEPTRGTEPDRSTLVHRIATAALFVGSAAYVLHEHPALRETAAALGSVGAVVFMVVMAVGRRR